MKEHKPAPFIHQSINLSIYLTTHTYIHIYTHIRIWNIYNSLGAMAWLGRQLCMPLKPDNALIPRIHVNAGEN